MAVGDLVVNLITRTDRFSRGLNTARGGLSGFANFARSSMSVVATAAAGAATGIAGLGIAAIKLAADAEQTQVAFEVMLGSAEKANQMLGSLRKLASSTPFGESEILASAKALLAFGGNAQKIPDELRMIGDLSSGLGIPIQELSSLWGKARAAGRLFAEDYNQFVERGIPLGKELAKQFGVQETEVRKLVESGKVGFPQLEQAFQSMTGEGGAFHKMMEKQSKTLAGRWGTMKDEAVGALRQIGVAILEEIDLKAALAGVTNFIDVFKKDWMPVVSDGIKLAADLGRTFGDIFEEIAPALRAVISELVTTMGEARDFIEKMEFKIKGPDKDISAAVQGGAFGLGAALQKGLPALKEKKQAEAVAKAQAVEEKKQAAGMVVATHQAEKMLAGLIRSGIDGVRSGVMSLGPARREAAFRNEAGTLEANSSEAFDVMRANVGHDQKDKTPKMQLDELKKLNKGVEKLVKKQTNTGIAGIEIRGID